MRKAKEGLLLCPDEKGRTRAETDELRVIVGSQLPPLSSDPDGCGYAKPVYTVEDQSFPQQGLLVELRADRDVEYEADTFKVNRWGVGIQHDIARRPTFLPTGWDGTKPCVEVKGKTLTEYLNFDAHSSATNPVGEDLSFATFLVVEVDAAGGFGYFISWGSSGGAALIAVRMLNIPPNLKFSVGIRDNASLLYSAQGVTNHTGLQKRHIAGMYDGATKSLRLYLDGNLDIELPAPGLGTLTTNNMSLGLLRIGAGIGSGTNFKITHLLHYNRVPSIGEQRRIERSFRNLWGLR